MGWQRAMLLLCLTVAVVEGIVVTLAVGLNGPEAPLDAPPSCNMALERLSGCPRRGNVTNAAGGRLGLQLTTGSRIRSAAMPAASSPTAGDHQGERWRAARGRHVDGNLVLR
jgi:hypothetical protein